MSSLLINDNKNNNSMKNNSMNNNNDSPNKNKNSFLKFEDMFKIRYSLTNKIQGFK